MNPAAGLCLPVSRSAAVSEMFEPVELRKKSVHT